MLVCAVRGTLYAYRDACPACGSSLADGTLDREELCCPGCGATYNVRLAGQGLGDPALPLDPPPLLADHGVVSGLTVVIGSPSNPYGVLGTHASDRRVFAEDDVNFLQAVGNVLAATRERQTDDERLTALAAAKHGRPVRDRDRGSASCGFNYQIGPRDEAA